MATSLSTLQTWLDEALAAKQKILTQSAAVEVSSPDGLVKFSEADIDKLNAWIQQLQSWISSGGMTATPIQRPVRFLF